MRLWLDVYDSSGDKVGLGPIQAVVSFAASSRLNRAGTWQALVALDTRALDLLQPRRTALAWMADDTARWFVGGGVIDQLQVKLGTQGEMLLDVSGQDLLEELNRYAVGETVIDNTLPATEEGTQFYQFLRYWLPSSWSMNYEEFVDPLFIHLISYDTYLGVLTALSDRFGLWFRRATTIGIVRVLNLVPTLPSTVTLRAIGNGAPDITDLNTCVITDITVQQQATDILTQVAPFGSGNADARLTIDAATEWPDGTALTSDYVVDGQTLRYIAPFSSVRTRHVAMVRNLTALAVYDDLLRAVAWKDIAPISNSTPDVQNAANALLAAACSYLLAHRAPVQTYDLTIAGLRREVTPGELVHVTARRLVENQAPIVIDADLRVLEVSTQVDAGGLSTVGLVVSTADGWPQSDADALVEAIRQSEIMAAVQQMGPSVDTISYREPIDDDYSADLHFWLGDEVTTVSQVLLRFRVDPLRSTAKAIGGSATGTVDLPDHKHGVTTNNHTHSVSIGSHTHGVPDHDHNFTISGGSDPTYPVGFGAAGTAGGLVHNASGSDFAYPTDSDTGGTTTASGGSSTPTSSGGGGESLTSADGGAVVGVEVDISGALALEYGIYEDSGANTYGAGSLEWLVNGVAATESPVSIGGGWYAFDITDDVIGAGNRPAQAANVVTVRVAAAAQTGKRCQVTARIQCRTRIQAIAYR